MSRVRAGRLGAEIADGLDGGCVVSRGGRVSLSLDFDLPPDVPLWRAVVHRGRTLSAGESIPALAARAGRLPDDPGAYRALCGFPPAGPLPPTWPAVATRGLQLALLTAPEFPLPVLGIVHVRQQIRWARPLRAEEPLAATCRVEGHRVARTGGEFDLVTEVSARGEVVWTGITTILSRAIPGDGEKRARPASPDFTVRHAATWTLPAGHGRAYAAVSGDWNPIHLHPLSALPFGYRRPIMHGWWLLARALAELDGQLPAAALVDARFLRPVALPAQVAFTSGPVGAGLGFTLRAPDPCVVGTITPLGGA